jgi:biofilm PGA synthesis protein PgaD
MTVLFWALWIYLWLPVLGLLGWVLGIRIGYHVMVVQNGFVGLIDQLGWYSTIVAVLGGSLLLWAYYNLLRFRGVERRRGASAPRNPALHERYGISAALLASWTAARRVELHHDAEGKLISPPPEPAPAAPLPQLMRPTGS